MRLLEVRNAHQALPMATELLERFGVSRDSRNGPVLTLPDSVTTTYTHPTERIVFWPERDYNVAFVLYEALWMLAGRNDLAPLLRYVKTFGQFSDDGQILFGAYGWRWRRLAGFDQLAVIADRLRKDPLDRRCVLEIWNSAMDLGNDSKDVPCNDTVTFQRDADGRLNMTVFCRSNDILWGAYYANAFHFGMLLEYMASWIGCPVGRYEQISVNWHGYLSTMPQVAGLHTKAFRSLYSVPYEADNPYRDGKVRVEPMPASSPNAHPVDFLIGWILNAADHGFNGQTAPDSPWAKSIYMVLYAHHLYKTVPGMARFDEAHKALDAVDPKIDWVLSMRQWLIRRNAKAILNESNHGVVRTENG
jgi:thymidylate synthase